MAAKIIYILKGYGMNDALACGITANIWTECRYDTSAGYPKRSSIGICQWTSSGGRATNFLNFVGENWPNELSLQLQFMASELSGSERGAWNAIKDLPNTRTGAYDAGRLFSLKFERPAGGEDSARHRAEHAVTLWDNLTSLMSIPTGM